jgi:hypothetical protein
LTGCFAIAIHSFVEFNLQVTSNAQMFLALAALATIERRKHDTHDGDARGSGRRAIATGSDLSEHSNAEAIVPRTDPGSR